MSQPPAHWLELTAGLTFTEMGAEPAAEGVENLTATVPTEDPYSVAGQQSNFEQAADFPDTVRSQTSGNTSAARFPEHRKTHHSDPLPTEAARNSHGAASEFPVVPRQNNPASAANFVKPGETQISGAGANDAQPKPAGKNSLETKAPFIIPVTNETQPGPAASVRRKIPASLNSFAGRFLTFRKNKIEDRDPNLPQPDRKIRESSVREVRFATSSEKEAAARQENFSPQKDSRHETKEVYEKLDVLTPHTGTGVPGPAFAGRNIPARVLPVEALPTITSQPQLQPEAGNFLKLPATKPAADIPLAGPMKTVIPTPARFIETGKTSTAGAEFAKGNRPQPLAAAQNFTESRPRRPMETQRSAPAKMAKDLTGSNIIETLSNDHPGFGSFDPTAANKRENNFGHDFVGRHNSADTPSNFSILNRQSKWADLPELDLGGNADGSGKDPLRAVQLTRLEQEQKGERWSV